MADVLAQVESNCLVAVQWTGSRLLTRSVSGSSMMMSRGLMAVVWASNLCSVVALVTAVEVDETTAEWLMTP